MSVTSTFSWIFPAAGVEAPAVVRTAARYGERLTIHGATLQVLARLRAQVFASATRTAPRQLRRFHSGDLLDRVQADIDSLDRAILAVAVPTVVAAIIGASGLAVPALIRPAFALVTGLALAAAVAGELVAGRRGRRAGGNLARARAAARARLVEVLDGRAEIAAYDAGPRGLGPRRRQAPRARGWHGRQSSALDRQARPARWRAYLADRCLGGRQVDAASGTGGALQPMAGTVRIGRTRPHRLEYEDPVAGVTLVEQDSLLLSGTVADNLRLARGSPRGESSR